MPGSPEYRPGRLEPVSSRPRTRLRRRPFLGAAAAVGLAPLLASCGPNALAPAGLAGAARRRVARALAPAAARRAAGPPPTHVLLQIDTGRSLGPISPLIYGVAVADPEQLAATGATLNRWGGNPSSRYNWELGNAWNAARDWEFRNGSYGHTSPDDRRPSGVADRFIAANRRAGAETLLTIPALGWVARDDSNQTRSTGVPAQGGPPLAGSSGAIAGYDPAPNRLATSVRSLPRKGAPFADPPDLTDEVVYQDEWVAHLVKRFGPADAGGVRYYAIDNEPDLWAETHTDVHPAQLGYEDSVAIFLDYARAIKDVDPGARVVGPCLSGWTALFYSARDRGIDGFRTHAERRAHGDRPFLPWWLEQVRRHDEQEGRRTLDILDVHCYPQAAGVLAGATDDVTNALRLRSTRALWDPGYTDESWIGEPVYLIRRLRTWIDRYSPGTELAIGEWSWGAETTLNGALAIADVLGIFGREGVDLAAYWTCPPPGSPGALAFRLYTNYDGEGSAFGDQALAARSDAPDDVAVYASRESRSNDLVVIVINKRPEAEIVATLRLDVDRTASPAALARPPSARAPAALPSSPDPAAPPAASTASAPPPRRALLYQLSTANPAAIRALGEMTVIASGTGYEVALTLPPSSATLLRLVA